MSDRSLLVVGVGNRSRGDDGIGPAVVDAVRAEPDLIGVETAVVDGDLSDLVVTWTPDHDVVVVDAMVGGGRPGTIITIDGLRDRLPSGPRPLSSHGFGLVDTIELARRLGRSPRSLTVIAVQLDDTGLLEPLTGPVGEAVGEVVSTIAELAASLRRADDRRALDQRVHGEESEADPPVIA